MKNIILVIFLAVSCLKNNNILKNMNKNINEELILAIEEGKIFQVSSLIDEGADVNYVNKDNKSVLEIAINKASIEIIKILLENDVKINKEEDIAKIYDLALNKSRCDIVEYEIIKLMKSMGYNLKDGIVDRDKQFLALCCTSSVDELKKFIEVKNVDPSQVKSALNTCLHSEKIDIAKFLIENYKMDLDFKDDYCGDSSLLMACSKGYIDIVNLILDRNTNININDNDKNVYDGRTPLHLACLKDNLELAKLLLSRGANVNHEESDGCTALMHASCGSEELVKLLLDYKADVNIKNKYNSTALSHACSEGKIEIVKLLLNSNIDINRNAYALVSASENGNLEIIKLLLKKGFNLNVEDNEGFTPLMRALEHNNSETVKFLLEKGANVNHKSKDEEGVTPLMLAFQNSDIAIVKLIIEKGSNVFEKNKEGTNLIEYALYNSDRENLLNFLLEKGLNIDERRYDSWTVLMLASYHGRVDTVNLLLKKGANIDSENSNGSTSLMLAIQEGKEKVVKILLENDAKIEHKNKYGSNSLRIAFKNFNEDIAKMLLEKGANINQKDSNGYTELMLAAREGKKDLANFLLENSVNINERDKVGNTALMIAAQKGHLELVELLLEKGANINDKNQKRCTALILASEYGHKEIVKLLLEKEADINSKNDLGNTALMESLGGGYKKDITRDNLDDTADIKETKLNLSSESVYIEVADLLIKNLCDINAKNNRGYSSLMLAAFKGYKEISNLLLQNGADINIKDKHGKCALSYALSKNNREIVKILLENFCEVDDKVNLNNILEELIVEKIKNRDIENALLLIFNYKDKINFNFKDSQDNSFLHYAAVVGDYKLFGLLLKDKFHINSINKNRETPLYCALSQEKIDESFICYLLNKGAILGPQSFINQKPIVEILSPFQGICNKLVYEPLIEKFSSTSPTFACLNSFKMEMKDKFKELVRAVKLKQEDFVNEASMIDFLRDILVRNSIKKNLNLNEVDIKAILDLDINLFDEIFNNFTSEDYCSNILAKGIEESKKFFKEKLAKIINAKPALVDSNLSENDENFKEFIAKKRLYKLIMLIRVLRGISKNDQKIKIILNDLLDNLVCKNASLESIHDALKSLSGKDIDIKEIIDEHLMNLRYEILKEVVNEEIAKNEVSVEIDGELYETALTPHLLSNLTLNIGEIVKLKPIYDQYNLKYKYNKNYIAKEVLKRYELKMVNYLQNRILEDKILNDRIRDYIEKDIFKERFILEVDDFIYDREGKMKEDALKALLIRFKFFISNNYSSALNFNFGSSSNSSFSNPSNLSFGPSTSFNFNFPK